VILTADQITSIADLVDDQDYDKVGLEIDPYRVGAVVVLTPTGLWFYCNSDGELSPRDKEE
jgi:hypothetical protein